MAQPTAMKYLGAVRVTAGVTYMSSDIITTFVGANVLQAKLDPKNDKLDKEGFVRAAVNGSPMFHFIDGEYCYIASGQTFVFDKDFTAAVGMYVAI